MKIRLFIIVCFSTLASFAQGEANIWYFGNHAGLDFNSGSPVALTNGQLNTEEGCAVLSNTAGQLLFYTDGVTVYNKNHQVMLNGTGLMGHSSTTQSATIVPKPGSINLYYIFTIDVEARINGFRYSIVDINLDGGLGAITTDKNVLVYTRTCEKISIVKHANNIDFWIITHGWNNNVFNANLLTASGLNMTPVVSNSGVVVNDTDYSNSMGYMKISPNGKKLALCHQFLYKAELFDFDNSTGTVSNPITLFNNEMGQLYGTEFSPNSNVLYFTTALTRRLYQFDLTATNIPASIRQLESLLPFVPGALQLGPDNKIYMAEDYLGKLSVINNPNQIGACDFQLNAIDLGGKISRLGLPAFNQSFFFNTQIQLSNACVGQSTQFTLNSNQTILNATWDFGDGTPAVNSITASHTFMTPNTYTVTVLATSALGTSTKTRDVIISALPTATQPQNMLGCDDDNDGFYDFNLTAQSTVILNGQNASQYSIRYFANMSDYTNNVAIANPTSYQNDVASLQQTIIAEISNNANGNCKATTTFTIAVFDSPKPNAPINIPTLTSCDNTSVGTDIDGKVIFDLTQRATTILNGQSAAQFSIAYYRDAALTNQILTPVNYSNTNPTETIYVKVVNNANTSCTATTSFGIQVLSLPVTTITNLKQCDDNIDGFSVFNLTEANSKISTNYVNETFSYFETLSEAQNNINPILNFTTYTNQIVSNDMVFIKVSNTNDCSRIAQLNLIVSTTQIPLNFTRTFTQCDDAILGTNTDGIASFDFSSVTPQIQSIFPAGQQLIITYYRNLADALAENNAITDISNYRNIGYPNTQNIYIRVDSALNNDCLGLGQHITLNVERIPIVLPQELKHCDDNQDGQYAFDTSNVEANLLNGLTNVNVTYFDQNNVQLSSPLPNPFVTGSQTITAVVANATTTKCNYQTTIQFVVDDLPEAFPIPANLTTVCDDEANPVQQDGQLAFDTSTFQSTILNGQTGMIVRYYDANNILLPSPLPNPFVTATQNVRVEVINPINTSCTASLVIPFVVKPVPNINLIGDELVCNEQTITKVLDAGILDGTPTTDYTYVWKLNGTVLVGEINPTLIINTAGIYTVEVSNSQGCSRTRTITVIASDRAAITNVAVLDLSNNNSIVVNVSGLGDYVYSLDNITFQESNTFTNVEAGVYTVYVKDLNGCGIAEKEISVLGIPDFFTPNGDGYNDYWNIRGINSKLSATTTIHIFDRFGKLLKQISPSTQGWDGKWNGQSLPATDYWYSIALGDGRIVKGHFALKR